MKSPELKVEALCWLRYVKKMELICTEGGPWASDVLGTNDNYSIEVEVKTSRADVLAEFRKKTAKHFYYTTGERWCPNYFYFLIPMDLVGKVEDVITEKMPNAGILAAYAPGTGRSLVVIKKAARLRKNKPTDKFKRQVMLRMGSELCGTHLALREFRRDNDRDVSQEIVNLVANAVGPVEWEPEHEEDVHEGSV
ncbi:hypothetical protein [Myxococcus phage Mx1]|nr:hypothetical protein [Myxococcus phage Mx1]